MKTYKSEKTVGVIFRCKRCKLVLKNDENGFSKIADALPMPAPRAPGAARPAAPAAPVEAGPRF